MTTAYEEAMAASERVEQAAKDRAAARKCEACGSKRLQLMNRHKKFDFIPWTYRCMEQGCGRIHNEGGMFNETF